MKNIADFLGGGCIIILGLVSIIWNKKCGYWAKKWYELLPNWAFLWNKNRPKYNEDLLAIVYVLAGAVLVIFGVVLIIRSLR